MELTDVIINSVDADHRVAATLLWCDISNNWRGYLQVKENK
jgi:hypothetical protein